MKATHQLMAGMVMSACAMVVGAQQAQQQAGTQVPAPGQIVAPAGHPPVAGAAAESALPALAGKVEIDPNAKFVHFRVGSRNVKDILVEGDVVWVGTSGGVVRYNTKTDEYKLYDNRSGLLSNGVFHIARLGKKLGVGTYGGGLSLLDEATQKWETYNIPDGLGDAFVYDMMETKNGDLWIATWSGANRVRGGSANLKDRSKWDLYTVENTNGGLPNDWVYGLAEGKNGIVWFATEGGLARFENGKWDNWNHSKGLGANYDLVKKDQAFTNDPAKVSSHHARQKEEMGLQDIDTAYNPNYIVSMAVDKDGIVWVGTWGGGLSRFDGKTFTNYTKTDGLPGNHVFMLHYSAKNELWVGTNAGLAKKVGNKYEYMTVADGLFSNTVFSMDTSKDGTLWVGSFGGVARIYPKK